MPSKDGTGPKGHGPRDGRGGGKGRGIKGHQKGQGTKKGGRKGKC